MFQLNLRCRVISVSHMQAGGVRGKLGNEASGVAYADGIPVHTSNLCTLRQLERMQFERCSCSCLFDESEQC